MLKENDNSEGVVLTADILTSKNVPRNYCFNNISKNQFDECEHYLEAFLSVCYWCGNMMPVVSSYSPGRGDYCGLDNWKVKLDFILSVFYRNELNKDEQNNYTIFLKGEGRYQKQKQLWPGWIDNQWNANKDNSNNLNEFIKQNYLYDCVYKKDNKFVTKNMVTQNKVDSFDDTNFLKLHTNVIKQWFIFNTKLIIQRSYRILSGVQEDFNEEQKKFIQEVFKKVFLEAGFTEKDFKEKVIDLELI